MMLTTGQILALYCFEAQGYRLTYATTGQRVLVWIDDYLHLIHADGSLGPEVNCE